MKNNSENINNNEYNEPNSNNINLLKLCSIPDSFPKTIFKNIKEEKLNNFKCKYCDLISLYSKVLEEDDQIICNECYSRLKKVDNIFKEKSINQESTNILKQIIGNLNVSCVNLNCNWEGKLSKLKNHLSEECQHHLIKCPNKDCRMLCLRKDIKNHLNKCNSNKNIKIKCKYCQNEIIKKIINEHLEICPENFIDCDKNCGKKIKRKDMENHKLICPENLIKCKYWKFGCKKNIRRKYIKDHEKLEIYNHYNLVNNYINNILDEESNEIYEGLKVIKELQLEIEKKEKKNNERIEQNKLKEEIQNNPIVFEWNQKIKKQDKNYKKYNDYIPFTGNPIIFISELDNINKNIIVFKREKIYYSGNYYNNLEKDKYYFILSKEHLDLKTNTNFSFRIDKDPSTNRLPWIAFGLYNNINNNFFNINYFPRNGFYCLDIDSNTYYNGKMSKSDDKYDQLNLDTFITFSYIPNDNIFIIKDNDEFEIKFPNIPNNNCDLRLCFIFKGKDRAIIDYSY